MKKINSILVLSILTSCASYTVSTEDFVTQLKSTQQKNKISNVASLGNKYTSNQLERIKCIDKNGDKVWLYPNKNVNFVFQKNDGKNITIYYDTAIFEQDTIRGLTSRILGGVKKIPVKDIKKIKITTEGSKIEKIN